MFSKLVRRVFWGAAAEKAQRDRLTADQWPSVIYAIGDVHGCRDELAALERKIITDALPIAGEKWIVMLGDYVDRGPNSADVLDRLCAPPPLGFRRICLAGNHEIMMLRYFDAPLGNSDWLSYGGNDTLASYGIDVGKFLDNSPRKRRQILLSHIPAEHIALLRGLPLYLALPGIVFVHAGIQPGIDLNAQSEDDLLWIREPFLSHTGAMDAIVVHGHSPMSAPQIVGNRIGIDTGAFATGNLTAVRVMPDLSKVFLNSR